MGRYIIKRLLLVLPVLLGTSFIIYWMVWALPGDPITLMAGDRPLAEGVRVALTEKYNLEGPLHTRYFNYLGMLLSGDLGIDMSGRDISEQLGRKLPNTFRLAAVAIVVEIVLGITAGAIAGVRKGQFFDYFTMITTIIVVSIPTVVLAFGAQYIFGVQLKMLPIAGVNHGFISYLLPGFLMGAMSLAYVARLTRTSMVENFRQDYVRTARAKGLSPASITSRHTLRNSLIPVSTFIGADLGALIGGAVIVETVFNIPGIGRFVFDSIERNDGPAVVAAIIVMVFIYIIGILIFDLINALLDPRIRLD